jgi:hypothetical protein
MPPTLEYMQRRQPMCHGTSALSLSLSLSQTHTHRHRAFSSFNSHNLRLFPLLQGLPNSASSHFAPSTHHSLIPAHIHRTAVSLLVLLATKQTPVCLFSRSDSGLPLKSAVISEAQKFKIVTHKVQSLAEENRKSFQEKCSCDVFFWLSLSLSTFSTLSLRKVVLSTAG